jgi:hypothetical protein
MKTIELRNKANLIYVTITAYPDKGLIKDEWHSENKDNKEYGDFGHVDNFVRGIETILDIIKEGNGIYYKWLADLREMKGSWDSKRDWMANTVMPQSIANGIMYEAIVQPRNIFAKLSTQDTIMKLGKFELQQFNDYNQAMIWINSKVAERIR